MIVDAKLGNATANRLRYSYGVLIFASVSLLSILAVRNGSYYDDEIFNIDVVSAHDPASLWSYINSTDVHPPGSYLINKFLFFLFGSWDDVKIASGVMNGAALAIFGALAFDRIGTTARWALAILLMASSTHVLWGASVRWYAYFNPIFTISLGILLFSSINVTRRTIFLGVSIVLLFYVSYAALCAAPVLIVAHLARERNTLTRRDFLTLLLVGSISFLLCLPQFYTFIHVHLANRGGQTGSLPSASMQTAMTLLVGNTIFPIAIAPAIYSVVVTALGFYFLFSKPKSPLKWTILISLAVGILALVATGVGIKPRNSVFLVPLVLLVVALSLEGLRPIASHSLIALIALFQLAGAIDVVEHRGTIKGSYDTDYLAAMDAIGRWKLQCGGKFVVFHHDVVLGRLLSDAAISQSTPYAGRQDKIVDLSAGDCIVVVKTYHGNFTLETLSSHYKVMETGGLRQVAAESLSEDRNAAAKTWIGKDNFPKYLLVLQKDDVVAHVALPAWDFPCPGCSKEGSSS